MQILFSLCIVYCFKGFFRGDQVPFMLSFTSEQKGIACNFRLHTMKWFMVKNLMQNVCSHQPLAECDEQERKKKFIIAIFIGYSV